MSTDAEQPEPIDEPTSTMEGGAATGTVDSRPDEVGLDAVGLDEVGLDGVEAEFAKVEQTLRLLDDPDLEPAKAIEWLEDGVSPQASFNL